VFYITKCKQNIIRGTKAGFGTEFDLVDLHNLCCLFDEEIFGPCFTGFCFIYSCLKLLSDVQGQCMDFATLDRVEFKLSGASNFLKGCHIGRLCSFNIL